MFVSTSYALVFVALKCCYYYYYYYYCYGLTKARVKELLLLLATTTTSTTTTMTEVIAVYPNEMSGEESFYGWGSRGRRRCGP